MNDARADTLPDAEVMRRDGLWFLRLNRPQKRNSLSEAMLGSIAKVAADVAEDAHARALLIWGAGGHFCAGGDFAKFSELLDQPVGRGVDPIATHNREFGQVLEQLASLPVPSIAVVRGFAMGGGCGLAATCDRVIATEDATFAMPEVTLGIAPAQIAPFVIRRVGTVRGRWLMATNARLTADAALANGLADVVAPINTLNATVSEALRRLCAAEPRALHATLRVVNRAVTSSLSECLDEGAREFAELLRRGHALEGIAAARERRAPEWRAVMPELPEFG